jgi:sugar phosphate isomerase/epimerase
MPIARRHFLPLASARLLYTVPMLSAPRAKIRAGCQTRCFGMPIREEDRFLAAMDDIAATGYEGFETNFVNLQPYFDRPNAMLDACRLRRLELIGLHGAPRLQRRDLLEDELAQGLRIAKGIRALGGAYFVMSGSNLPRGAGLKAWTAEVCRLGRLCKEQGVTLAYHNHSTELENDGEILKALMQDTLPEEVSMLLDVSFFAGTALNASEYLTRYAQRIIGVHLRTMKGKEESMLAGDPDLAAIASTLHRLGWPGWAIVELNVRKDMSSRDMISECRKFMREKMKI